MITINGKPAGKVLSAILVPIFVLAAFGVAFATAGLCLALLAIAIGLSPAAVFAFALAAGVAAYDRLKRGRENE